MRRACEVRIAVGPERQTGVVAFLLETDIDLVSSVPSSVIAGKHRMAEAEAQLWHE